MGHLSFVICPWGMGEMFVVTTSVVIPPPFNVPTSVVFALLGGCQVTPRYQGLPPVPKQTGGRPADCSCDGDRHHTRATTQVVTTNAGNDSSRYYKRRKRLKSLLQTSETTEVGTLNGEHLNLASKGNLYVLLPLTS